MEREPVVESLDGSMMEEGEEEQVMSEVHLGCPPRFSGPYISRFTFSLPPAPEGHNQAECMSQLLAKNSFGAFPVDEDGDLVVTRRKDKYSSSNYSLTIQHNITSSLSDVGLQVWKAAMVLIDLILHVSCTSSDFNGITAIELGAGTGLVGIALARVARTVFITDSGAGILLNCEKNVHLNSGLLKFDKASVNVKELNWKDSWPPSCVGKMHLSSDFSSSYSWNSSEIEEAESATLLFAADVVYSDDITDSFFHIVENLMSRGSKKVLYLALEKRYNFSLDDLDVVANGYAHFRSFIKDAGEDCAELVNTSLPYFIGKQVDFAKTPQYIREYDRGKDVEIWEIRYCFNKQTPSSRY